MGANSRAVDRFPCAIPIGDGGQQAPVGEVVDISLDGLRVATQAPLPPHSVVPLAFQLGAGGPRLAVEAQVTHRDAGHMGLRFVGLDPRDRRRLRRYVGELASVVGNRASARALLDAAGELARVPYTDAVKIRELLAAAAGGAPFIIIPAGRSERLEGRLAAIAPRTLDLEVAGDHRLVAGEALFVLYTRNFVSYSFRSELAGLAPGRLTLALPAAVSYSERRAGPRAGADEASVTLAAVPAGADPAPWPLVDEDAGGFSFRVAVDEAGFWPGMVLPELVLHRAGGQARVVGAQVRHLTLEDAGDGGWVRVGVALAAARAAPEASAETMAHLAAVGPLARLGRDLVTRATYLYHRRLRAPLAGSGEVARLVQFDNRRGQALVGLLNLAPGRRDGGPAALPTVIVTPGFGARKETMGALANILVDHFRRQGQGLAVLRYDGSNSVGESHKDPGCADDGKETLRYTVSGCIADVTGAAAWVRDNPLFVAGEIVVVSVSFSGVAVRRALTLPEMAGVKTWVSFMGAPDAQNAIMNVAGNIDGYALYRAGISMGTVSLLGCLTECDHFLGDMHRLGCATLQDACADMAKIAADVTWFVGRQDAYMDPARVRQVMGVAAPGRRRIVEIEAGHVPQSSDEALAGFQLMSRHIFRALTGRDVEVAAPARGRIAARMEAEWRRVRRRPVARGGEFWAEALGLTGGALGFDAYLLVPEYVELVDATCALADVHGKEVLEVGAGTGNLARALHAAGPAALTCLDVVGGALERLAGKLPAGAARCVTASAEGGPRVALRRWLAGDLSDFGALLARLPPALSAGLAPFAAAYGDDVHAFVRGGELDAGAVSARRGLGPEAAVALAGLRALVAALAGRPAAGPLADAHAAVLATPAGLPFADGSFDVVVAGLLLSCLAHPDDALSEMRRVLRPGGRLVVSSMLVDADLSAVFAAASRRLGSLPAGERPAGVDRDAGQAALRALAGRHAAQTRLREEGVLRAWSGGELRAMVAAAGFQDIILAMSFGRPARAAICGGRRPF